jgi:hypothetical protein
VDQLSISILRRLFRWLTPSSELRKWIVARGKIWEANFVRGAELLRHAGEGLEKALDPENCKSGHLLG